MYNKPDFKKYRILISGCLPPPMGGMATFYQTILASSLKQRIDMFFVETSSHGHLLENSGRFSLTTVISSLSDCWRFAMAVIRLQPKITHIGTAFGLSFIKHSICVFIARLAGTKILLHPHCSLSGIYTEQSWLWKWYFKRVIKLTDGIIGLSSEWKQLSTIIPDSRVYVLHNAIDLSPYTQIARERVKNSKCDNHINILYLGYLGRAKGSFDLIEAIHQLNDVSVSFELIGDELRLGDLKLLRQSITKADLSEYVSIHPPVMGDEKISCFQKADIFVYPSHAEGLPMAVIEAMASGLPIISTNVGGLPDLVQMGINGILVDPHCPDELATALRTLISDSDLRHSMQSESVRIASEGFDIEKQVLRLVEIYAQCN
jgi:glycosyltransferase involved in cell wall biosynthesis